LFNRDDIGFDAYSDSVREADVSFVLSGEDVSKWGVAQQSLDHVVLQFASVGGASIAFGITRPDATVFVLQHSEFERMSIFNGQMADPYDIAVLPPSSNFTFASSGPHQWLSISVPVDLQAATSPEDRDAFFPTKTMHIACSSAAMRNLKSVAVEQASSTSEAGLSSAERDNLVLRALRECIDTKKIRKISPRLARMEKLIVQAQNYIRAEGDNDIRLAAVCNFMGMTERRFRDSFQRYFGISPHRYLRLRQLNLARRAIRFSDRREPITRIALSYGLTEFGRFAGEYKAMFGETPSETLRVGNA
jgi:AraC family transcriptional regulator, ethanolamine operon transcriptional activator